MERRRWQPAGSGGGGVCGDAPEWACAAGPLAANEALSQLGEQPRRLLVGPPLRQEGGRPRDSGPLARHEPCAVATRVGGGLEAQAATAAAAALVSVALGTSVGLAVQTARVAAEHVHRGHRLDHHERGAARSRRGAEAHQLVEIVICPTLSLARRSRCRRRPLCRLQLRLRKRLCERQLAQVGHRAQRGRGRLARPRPRQLRRRGLAAAAAAAALAAATAALAALAALVTAAQLHRPRVGERREARLAAQQRPRLRGDARRVVPHHRSLGAAHLAHSAVVEVDVHHDLAARRAHRRVAQRAHAARRRRARPTLRSVHVPHGDGGGGGGVAHSILVDLSRRRRVGDHHEELHQLAWEGLRRQRAHRTHDRSRRGGTAAWARPKHRHRGHQRLRRRARGRLRLRGDGDRLVGGAHSRWPADGRQREAKAHVVVREHVAQLPHRRRVREERAAQRRRRRHVERLAARVVGLRQLAALAAAAAWPLPPRRGAVGVVGGMVAGAPCQRAEPLSERAHTQHDVEPALEVVGGEGDLRLQVVARVEGVAAREVARKRGHQRGQRARREQLPRDRVPRRRAQHARRFDGRARPARAHSVEHAVEHLSHGRYEAVDRVAHRDDGDAAVGVAALLAVLAREVAHQRAASDLVVVHELDPMPDIPDRCAGAARWKDLVRNIVITRRPWVGAALRRLWKVGRAVRAEARAHVGFGMRLHPGQRRPTLSLDL